MGSVRRWVIGNTSLTKTAHPLVRNTPSPGRMVTSCRSSEVRVPSTAASEPLSAPRRSHEQVGVARSARYVPGNTGPRAETRYVPLYTRTCGGLAVGDEARWPVVAIQ